MIYRDVIKLLGRYFFFFSFLLLIPLFVSLYFEYFTSPSDYVQPSSAFAFAFSFVCCLLFSGILNYFGKDSKIKLFRKESILAVVLIWVLSPLISSLPFIFSGTLTNPLQAYFESASGFTATGSTVLTAKKYDDKGKEIPIELTIPGEIPVTYSFYGNVDPIRNEKGQIILEGIEAVSKGVLFWRSFIQWLGGMGIVVLFIIVLPSLGIGGKQLASSEIPGPVETTLAPRIIETASILWKIYLFFTVVQTLLLKSTNTEMPFFDAITTSFTTLATGGFSVKNESIGAYQNAATEWIVIVFMIIGSLNFSIWFHIIKGKIYRTFESEIFIYFTLIILSCAFATYSILGEKEQLLSGEWIKSFSFAGSLRNAVFQIVSASSTTGFSTTNFDIWPYKVQTLMLLLMYAGGMAGSTTSGIKILRLYILFKVAQFKCRAVILPQAIKPMQTSWHRINEDIALKSLIFFFLIIAISVISTFLFVIDGVDPESALTLVGCNINGVGFSFRAYGPMQSSAFLSDFGLALSSFLMIAGRLEFFALLTVLTPAFWKKNT